MQSRDLLDSFTEHCRDHPTERFWQALRNWAGVNFILASNATDYAERGRQAKDTFYWDARNGHTRSVDAVR